jgi:proton-dependent oligopeptide transporter, POT family
MTETAPSAPRPFSPLALFAEHPRPLPLLFFTEMWERFSYYGMRALLILYLTEYLAVPDASATAIYGGYTALVYIGPVLGGFLADRVLGARRAVAFGGILIALGHFTLAMSHLTGSGLWLFYLALALIIAGTAFFKGNVSTLVGTLYEPGDKRRDAGFTLFYMGINIGAFAATVLCGWLGQSVGWAYGFGLAGFGMLAGLAVFFRGIGQLGGAGKAPDDAGLARPVIGGISLEWAIYIGGIAVIALALGLVQRPDVVGGLLSVMGIASAIGLVAYAVISLKPDERDRVFVIIALAFFTILFLALFEQQGSSMNLLAERNIDRRLFGIDINAAQYQSLNPFFILVLAPILSRLWPYLERKGAGLSTPSKFALSLALMGASFAVLVMGAAYTGQMGMVPMIWLVLAYFLQTTAELCLMPIGLSMVTKLSPKGLVSLMMGLWLLAWAGGEYLAGKFAGLASVTAAADGSIDRVASLHAYSGLFGILAALGFLAALLLVGLRGILASRMHGAD